MGQTLVIAEPACTHEGRLDRIVALLETAAECGANVFKPEWVSDPEQMLARRHIGPDHPQHDYYARAYGWLAFPLEWHTELSQRAHALGLQYACTSFLPQDVMTLDPFVDAHKVASFESADVEMRHAHRPHRKLIYVSHGGGSPWIEWGARALQLHCVSAYPAPLKAMNLAVLRDETRGPEGGEYPRYDGLSDHSRHVLTGAVAVALGARLIETHYRLDSCDPQNPDYPVSFTPAEFAQYIHNIREAEVMLGDGVKKLEPCEQAMVPYRVA